MMEDNIDISFLKPYLKAKEITQEKLSLVLGYRNSTSVTHLLNDDYKLPFNKLNKLLEFFEVESIEELKQVVDRELEKINCYESTDISFLKPYLKAKGISKKLLALVLDCSVYNLLNGYSELPFDKINKLLKFFDVSSIEELKQKVDKELEEDRQNVKTKLKQILENSLSGKCFKVDISFLKLYFEIKEITNLELMEALDYKSHVSVVYLLNGNNKLPFNKVDRLLEYLKIIDKELMKEVMESLKNGDKDNDKLINDDKSEICEPNEENTLLHLLGKVFEIFNSINKEAILEELEVRGVSKRDIEIASILLSNSVYKFKIISITFNLDEKELIELYKYYINLYNEILNSKTPRKLKFVNEKKTG